MFNEAVFGDEETTVACKDVKPGDMFRYGNNIAMMLWNVPCRLTIEPDYDDYVNDRRVQPEIVDGCDIGFLVDCCLQVGKFRASKKVLVQW